MRRRARRISLDPQRELECDQYSLKAQKNMAALDSMPPDWRALAYEYGLSQVWRAYCERVRLEDAHALLHARQQIVSHRDMGPGQAPANA